jgi:hypothetical protein
MDAKETLAKCGEDRNVENGIRSQLIRLNPIDKQKPTKKFVDSNGQAANKEISENYPKTFRRIWSDLIS